MGREDRSSQLKVHHEDTLPPRELIDLFKLAFNEELYGGDDLDELLSQIQKVKSDLYNRDYSAAFNDEIKRIAYCCRWSPSRATAYASLFAHFKEVSDVVRCPDSDQSILCIGGGAGGELVAFASLFAPTRDFSTKYSVSTESKSNEDLQNTLNVHIIDISDWSNVVKRLTDTIQSRWLYADVSKYFNVNFCQEDILKGNPSDLQLSNLNLITLLFTTNELFSENRTESIKLLQRFNQHCKKGCYLLITESAGSYSHITIGSKNFPIQFLVDTVLVGKRGQEASGSWLLISQSESTWYRGDPQLDYPMKLENMRVFYRLYKKT